MITRAHAARSTKSSSATIRHVTSTSLEKLKTNRQLRLSARIEHYGGISLAPFIAVIRELLKWIIPMGIPLVSSPIAPGFGLDLSLNAPAADETIRVDLLRLTAHLAISSHIYTR